MNARDRMQELVFDCEMQAARRRLVDLVSSIDDGCDITIGTIMQLARMGAASGNIRRGDGRVDYGVCRRFRASN